VEKRAERLLYYNRRSARVFHFLRSAYRPRSEIEGSQLICERSPPRAHSEGRALACWSTHRSLYRRSNLQNATTIRKWAGRMYYDVLCIKQKSARHRRFTPKHMFFAIALRPCCVAIQEALPVGRAAAGGHGLQRGDQRLRGRGECMKKLTYSVISIA